MWQDLQRVLPLFISSSSGISITANRLSSLILYFFMMSDIGFIWSTSSSSVDWHFVHIYESLCSICFLHIIISFRFLSLSTNGLEYHPFHDGWFGHLLWKCAGRIFILFFFRYLSTVVCVQLSCFAIFLTDIPFVYSSGMESICCGVRRDINKNPFPPL